MLIHSNGQVLNYPPAVKNWSINHMSINSSALPFHLTDLSYLSLNSTLADLPTHEFEINPHTPGHIVATTFEDKPTLPGVIIREGDTVSGAFSRRKFLEYMGRPYGVEVFLKRPIQVMLDKINQPYLMLSSDCPIHDAAEMALRRPLDLFYEPIVITYPDHKVRLLDIYILLLAQSQLLTISYQLEQKRRHFAEALQKTGQVLTSSLNLAEVPQRILTQVTQVIYYERGSVWLRKENYLELIAQRGFPKDKRVNNLQIMIHTEQDDVFRRMMDNHQPIVIGDVVKETSWQQVDWLPLHHAWMGVPMIAQNQVIGMISLTREAPHSFNYHDAMWVLAFAGQAAIALENARLYNHIMDFNDHLEHMVTERTSELNQMYGILEKLNQTKSDFITVSAHELRTPLTIINGYAQVLTTNPTIQADENIAAMIDGILNGTNRLYQIVNSLLDVAKIESNSLGVRPEPIVIANLIEPICDKLADDLQNRQLTLAATNLNQLPELYGDVDLLIKVFYGLIINAIKYTPDGGKINVTGHVTDAQAVEVVVSDTGIGIDTAHHDLIFEKFYQTGELALHSSGQTKFKGGGPGLGLAIAKGIVEAHGGQIWVESSGYNEQTCPGSRFHVSLPLAN